MSFLPGMHGVAGFFREEAGAPAGAPLDNFGAGLTAALSVSRRLMTAYNGSAIRVRRASDNAEQNIGFSDALLDTAGLLSFVGAGNGYVATIYDQSGNGRNFSQATPTKQAMIVNSGSLVTAINGKPAMLFDNVDDNYASGMALSFFVQASAYTTFEVFRAASGAVTGNVVLYDHGGGYLAHYCEPTSYSFNHFSTVIEAGTRPASYPENVAVLSRFGSSVLNVYKNGGTPGTKSSAGNIGNLTKNLGISTDVNAQVCFDGHLSEVIIFKSNLDVNDCNIIGNDIGAFYGIPWTAI